MYYDNTDRAFKICHAADAASATSYGTIPWVTLDDTYHICPTSVKASSNIISRSFDDMNGDFQDWPIAHKAKINWIFEAEGDTLVANSQGQVIRTAAAGLVSNFINGYIFTKIKQYKSRVFLIAGWAPGYGKCWGKFYLGTPTNFNSEGVSEFIRNTSSSVKFELHWIEVGDSSTHIQSISDTVNN